MDKENEIIKDAQTLHSDMQTLVYENYNKFISATETIKKVPVFEIWSSYSSRPSNAACPDSLADEDWLQINGKWDGFTHE